MKKPTLVIMAAGAGSRFGGMKQIAAVDNERHILMDFALYDAHMAGFEKVVFVIKPSMKEDFHETIGRRISSFFDVNYAFQEIGLLPNGFIAPPERVKPWGTAHAVLSAKNFVDSSFAVINADDFYGKSGFRQIYEFLTEEAVSPDYAMVGYRLENTLTENGYSSRGVCEIVDDTLFKITERTRIRKTSRGGEYSEDGESFIFLPGNTIVSMNLWGFKQSMMNEIENRFTAFLEENLLSNPLNCEYYLPFVCGEIIKEGKRKIHVLQTEDKWYGITYAQDMPDVKSAIAEMKKTGLYPEKLWEKKYD